ncbi:ISLre2 family transposase [Salibacterium halotolerans]|uniref:Uncharacterized protein family (UPF0236) n=1 Tax=Salibacterium halotolerans TaxID=1884432 RepID=A0A1I5YGV4_9BACI|nr:ISLre2 family transposase [Salibacterium halotolerans]SFQ43443.1 Uncharacterised protein family (UPF0236) [Salibacterium halotolerans]
MTTIITEMYQILKETPDVLAMEEKLQQLMYHWFSDLVGEALTSLDEPVREAKKKEGWDVETRDARTVQFLFGPVAYSRTLMTDREGISHYPLDEHLSIQPNQRYSPLVEVKTAEMTAESTYREVERVLKEWTPVSLSHQTVGAIVKRVGEAQAEADKGLVTELDEAAELPSGREVSHLYAEADGVFVRGTAKKQGIEVSHAITYEGWDTNGKRVALQHPNVLMTTQPTAAFWKEVQAATAHRYSLETTQVVTNSDGGAGYTPEKFQEAFSQSQYPVLNQLDAYHVHQALNRALGAAQSETKTKIREALREHNQDDFRLWLDTYESTLEEDKAIEKVKKLRSYILENWDRIIDWRDHVEDPPEGARSLGAMESNQRHVTFRMKRRGMHWSPRGAEAMVKIKQGLLNRTLREAYLARKKPRSVRQQRRFAQMVRMTDILRDPVRESNGATSGTIALHTAHSTAMGHMVKSFS